jgi:hypothetical protein
MTDPATQAQSQTQAETATATAATTPAGATSASAAGQAVMISAKDYQELLDSRAKLAQIEEARQREAQEAQRREMEALAQRGQIEAALRMLREQSQQEVEAERARLSQTEERAKRYALDGELSRALAAAPLASPAAAEQLTQLWRNQLTVEAQGDSFVVRTPTFQSVGEFVAQQLQRPEYAHFVRATTQGGVGGQTTQAAQTQTATPSPAPLPKTMGEAVILHMQSLQKAQGDPRTSMALPLGLRAAAR